MNEILVSGNCNNDFKRLCVQPTLTYSSNSTHYKVYEVSEKDFNILCNEPDIKGTWVDCGWRHCTGSNMGEVDNVLIVNDKELKCWYEEHEINELYMPVFKDLSDYIRNELVATTFKNVCAVCVDLAKYNSMKLSDLFKIYQGQ